MNGTTDTITGGGAIHCDVIDTVAGIDAVRDAWKSLQSSVALPYAKNDVDYFVAEMNHGSLGVSPCVLVVRENDTPKLLAVACVKNIHFKPQIGYFPIGIFARKPKRCLHVLPYGVLGDTENRYSKPLVSRMLSLLGNNEIDYVYMSLLPEDSPLIGAARSLPPFFSRDYLSSVQDHYTLRLAGGLEAFLKQKSSKTRTHLRALKKRMLDAFENDVRVRWYLGIDDVDDFCAQAEIVARMSYQRSIGAGFKDSPEIRRIKKFEAEKGWFRGSILFVKDRPVAYDSGVLYGGLYFGETTAFDPAMEKYSPGLVLDMEMIEKLGKDPTVKILDFGFGPDEYKKRFGNDFRKEVSVRIFAPSLQGYSMNALATVCEAITRGGRNIARKSGLYSALKRVVRKLLSRSSQ